MKHMTKKFRVTGLLSINEAWENSAHFIVSHDERTNFIRHFVYQSEVADIYKQYTNNNYGR